MTLLKYYIIALLCITPLTANAQNVIVGLEPFPPFINEDGSGFAIEMFNALTQQSDLNFEFNLMTWGRAKRELKSHHVDLIGISPKNNETADYYQYAKELDWSFIATVDLFSKEKSNLILENLPNKSIGTLIGNADFFAELSNIPRNKFVEISNLKQLVKMMDKGRIKTVIFDRISMMSTIKKLKLANIHYRELMKIPATFAVKNTPDGLQLQKKLDNLMSTKNIEKYQEKLSLYNKLPPTGIVNILD
ncbi:MULTISPECIES: transporter substrate-binding domain-containing protein [Thalassotalea]|uniref:Transporter substrate-binding domain-containing protein n=1 Tax=Thalassotalea castellviae TaxID=3075612 RepID=A0ABU3A3X3_9GAMM|nr:transporter substrate-binding domain-containing protein [Thalassotalea sp. W431]MDT0604605.1 transporter substrate-binding domain-containing protein [Thalassotalea sp. W431]